jgi:type IV pilus assembly protein PilB
MSIEELKPQAEAIAIVPQTMAEVYKVMPVTFQQGVLTVAIGDPAGLAGLDDLRNLLDVKEVHALLAPPKLVEEAREKAYTTKPDIHEIIQQLESDKPMIRKIAHRDKELSDRSTKPDGLTEN